MTHAYAPRHSHAADRRNAGERIPDISARGAGGLGGACPVIVERVCISYCAVVSRRASVLPGEELEM